MWWGQEINPRALWLVTTNQSRKEISEGKDSVMRTLSCLLVLWYPTYSFKFRNIINLNTLQIKIETPGGKFNNLFIRRVKDAHTH